MSTFTKSSIAFGVVAGIFGVAAFFGYSPFLKIVQQAIGSPAGSTFGTAKVAAVIANLANPGTTGTTTSILNTDAGTRYVTGVTGGCDGIGTSNTAYTGAGLAALNLSVGTSSVAGANTIGATAKVLTNATIPTSSVMYSFGSSTSATAGASSAAALWHSGEYMTFQFNATNTATCTVGVSYLAS